MKRFTETTKWDDPWFMDLPVKYKLFWLFILDRCDCAGIWDTNMRLAVTQIGEPLELAEVLRVFDKRIEKLENGKLYISGFIKFQYGLELNPVNTAHLGVIRRLKINKLQGRALIAPIKGAGKGLQRGFKAPKDKDKDKDKKGECEGKTWIQELKANPAFSGIDVDREFHKMCAWCSANGKQPTRRRFVNWLNKSDKPLSNETYSKPKEKAPVYPKLPPTREVSDEELAKHRKIVRDSVEQLKAQFRLPQ